MSQAWQPILEGELARRAGDAIDAIAIALRNPPPPHYGDEALRVSLMSREPGIAVFYAYLARAAPGAGHDELARGFLEAAIDHIPEATARPYFAYGFTGTAWAIEHLCRGFLASLVEDANQEVDEAVEFLVAAPLEQQVVGLRDGLAGYAAYLLERLPVASAARILEGVVDRLAALAIHAPEGVLWRLTRTMRVVDEGLPAGDLAVLGVMDGVAGVIAVLGATCAAGIAQAKAEPLLDGALRWLWAQRLPDGHEHVFPAHTGGPSPSSCGWSSGDLGIASILLAVGRALERTELVDRATEVARRVARLPPLELEVADATLDRGAAGIAHMFNHFYQDTHDMVFLDAARTWYARTLAMRRTGEGIGGYLTWSPTWQQRYIEDAPIGWVPNPGIVNGAAGIALALLAATTSIEPAWDRMMLLSTRSSHR